jgi:DNA (cytosine-5)-methyltransferase 1
MGEMQIDLSAEPITFSIGNLVRDSADENPKQTGICKTLRARMGDQFPCVCVKVGDSRNVINKIKKEKDNIQMNSLTLGSLFDGIGGFPLAAERAGIKTLWASEIEPAPIEITKKHFPAMKHLGDITKVDGSKIEPVDIISFGSPCQDLSVAGQRAGLSGERSGLFVQAIRIIREMRSATGGRYPRWALWENVPGALSSGKSDRMPRGGEDFRVVLEKVCQTSIPVPKGGRWAEAGMVECKDRQVAWRCLDAQYAVPQRRKRIFLVCDFAGKRADKVLFECQSLLGNLTEGNCKGEGFTAAIEKSLRGTGKDSNSLEPNETRAVALRMRGGKSGGGSGNNIPLVMDDDAQAVTENQQADIKLHDKCNSLTGGGGKPGQGYAAVLVKEDNPKYLSIEGDDKADTLLASYYKGCGMRCGHERTVVLQDKPIGVDVYNGNVTGDKACTLTTDW